MVIKDLNSLKNFFRKIKRPILGAGVYAFHRLGPENFIPNYQILSLYWSEETRLIQKNIPGFCLEKKIEKRLRPRNSSTLLFHPETQKYISRFQKPLILLYSSSSKIEKLALKYRFDIAISPYRFGKQFFEDKIKFRKILRKIRVPYTPGRILPLSYISPLHFSKLEKEFGLPFVLQYPRSGGGKGTFFITDKNEFVKIMDLTKEKYTEKFIVTKFIKGPSPSITGCVTKFGVLSTRPQYQICDAQVLYPQFVGSGLFCGHDWTASEFSKNILRQAREIVEKVGLYFKKNGYRGIFGLDFVEDSKTGKLYVTECNPRLLGSMPTLTMIELKEGIPPIIAFHLLEYLETPYSIDIKKILKLLWKKKKGAQMILHNPIYKEAIQRGQIQPGVYKIIKSNKCRANSKLIFQRPGYNFFHLKDRNEILFTEGLQKAGTEIEPCQRLTRILTQKRVLDADLKRLTPEAEQSIRLILRRLNVTKINKKRNNFPFSFRD